MHSFVRRASEPSGRALLRDAPRSVAVVGTYVPRQCGIATFSADLTRAMNDVAPSTSLQVIALNDRPEGYDYPDEVAFEIRQNVLNDYRLAGDYLNVNRVDAVVLQHEYGIFGGKDGSHVLPFLTHLRMPVVTTLHTVLKNPSPSQKAVLRQLADLSDRLVVMSETGRRFLEEVYRVPTEKIRVVPHGIPDLPFVDPNYYKDQFGVEGRKVLLTFGLLSPNKGIEYGIRALPRIVERHPDVAYIVLGATHPHVKRDSGETYRLGLQQLARDLGVENHVVFQDRYVSLQELCEFLGAADVYLTPYLNEDQIVSGTLAYALGAGKAVVSTPYWHAAEMLADGRGVLVPFRDAEAIAERVCALLDDEVERHAMRKRAYAYSRDAVWGQVGRAYLEVVAEAVQERQRRPSRPFRTPTAERRVAALPDLSLDHLARLTDDVGLLQHACYLVPDRAHGYCTDDNARALIVATLARPHVEDPGEVEPLALRYLAFLKHAFDERTGAFRNFMGYDRRWLPEEDGGDHHGRALWALGVAAGGWEEECFRALASQLLHQALPLAEECTDLRGVAYALLGLDAYLQCYGGDTAARRARHTLAERLYAAFGTATLGWLWPEEALTYANARLPQALLLSGRGMGREDMVQKGLSVLEWLMELQTVEGRFVPVGNRGWYRRGGERARFDQQPIEADATLGACAAAYEVTGDREWLDHGLRAFRWFLGENDLGVLLYDDRSGGCRDGLTPTGPNENQGAESTLAWLSALIQVHSLVAAGELGWTREGPDAVGESAALEAAS
ncbi:MAG: glycosyltransferase family 4 protein [Deferrisomatales bacterium]